MHLEKIPFAETRSFSSFFLDYIQQKESLKPFYNRFPQPENFKGQLADKQKSFPMETRQTLAKVLQQQYISVQGIPAVQQNIEALQQPNTFTVVTGHQLNIFTGPLYFIFKIVTVINTCKKLKALYPDYNFVPVYWMASEDHDFAEINHFKTENNYYEINEKSGGAVGRIKISDTFFISKV